MFGVHKLPLDAQNVSSQNVIQPVSEEDSLTVSSLQTVSTTHIFLHSVSSTRMLRAKTVAMIAILFSGYQTLPVCTLFPQRQHRDSAMMKMEMVGITLMCTKFSITGSPTLTLVYV